MGGSSGSGEDIEAGRTNYADGRTVLLGQSAPGQDFNGPAVLIVGPGSSSSDNPDPPFGYFHGLIATANGSAEVDAPQVGGIGVIGRGNAQGDTSGAGVVGQGGRQAQNWNINRAQHGPGVVGIAGGIGDGQDLIDQHPLVVTQGVGVYGQGGDATVTTVSIHDDTSPTFSKDVPSGPAAPGTGVLGRGGIFHPNGGNGFGGTGVVGLSGDTKIPKHDDAGDTGVYGRGPNGVQGYGDFGRGGIFAANKFAQLRLIPSTTAKATNDIEFAAPGDFFVSIARDARGREVASLWFCTHGGKPTSASWVKLA